MIRGQHAETVQMPAIVRAFAAMGLSAEFGNTLHTIFADADGDIAYFHGNYIPRRNTSFDWTKPVDGSNPETEWHGLLSVEETPHLGPFPPAAQSDVRRLSPSLD